MKIQSIVALMMICSLIFVAGCAAPKQDKKMTMTADSMVYNHKTGTMTAEGNVKITTDDGCLGEAMKKSITPTKK